MINKLIQENLKKNIPEKDVAILLSGGVDSLSVAFACQNIGKNITAYSFKIKDVDNYDYNMAKEVSKIFNWPFISYEIDKQNLKTDFFKLKELGCYKKTHYECMYPFLHLIPKIEQKYIATGWAADGYYGVSKRCMIHFRHTKELFDKFRDDYFLPHKTAGFFLLEKLINNNDKKLVAPYLSNEIKEFFYNKDWFELNHPYQKHHVRKGFDQFKNIPKVKKHINLQLGSKVNVLFETLLNDSEINFNKRSRIMDICKDWSKR